MLFNEPHLIPLNFMPCFTIFYSSLFLTFINILSLRDSASSQLADHSCCRAVGDIVIHSPSLPQWLDLLSSSLILSAPDLHLKTSVPRHLQFFFFFFGSSALSCPRFFCLPKCHVPGSLILHPYVISPTIFRLENYIGVIRVRVARCTRTFFTVHSFSFLSLVGSLCHPLSCQTNFCPFLNLPSKPYPLYSWQMPFLPSFTKKTEATGHELYLGTWYLLLCLPFHRPPHINHSPPSFSS